MAQFAPPLLVALLLWWFSTGAILWLVRLPRATFGWSLGLTASLAAAAAVGLAVTRADTGPVGAYVAFGCALAIWGWHEAAFLMGVVTGPRRTPLPDGATGWARFRASAETVIHHELALAGTAVGIAALGWGAPNPIGALTFALLLGLRLSTKLNIYLGVANLPTTFLPAPLAYLESYFRRRAFNPLFPLSLAACAGVTVLLGRAALDPTATAGEATGWALLSALSALGLLEHLFLMLPSPDRALWGWALGSAPKAARSDDTLLMAAGREP